MKLPGRNRDKVLARDKYKNHIWIHGNSGRGFDISTDDRIYLSPRLAKELSRKLAEIAEDLER